jgi:peptidoglycan/xylan/chitin deacetylase (PgdA/CDA1 family)
MAARTLFRRFFAGFLALFPAKLSGVSILIYHSVSQDGPGFITDSVAGPEKHLRFIKGRGLRTVFASEVPALLAAREGNAVCVTFDDGYRDNYLHAFPLLKRYGVKATLFLITDLVGGSRSDRFGTVRPMLGEAEIREMLASGLVELMPHSKTHLHLDTLSLEEAEREIAESKEAVEKITGKPSTIFAYPYGDFNPETVGIVKKLGFSAALGVRPGIARASSDPFDLPRNALGEVSRAELSVKLSDRLGAYLAVRGSGV